MRNRDTLTKWFYLVHEAVNKKLGIDYGVTYDDVVCKYESFRARCSPVSAINDRALGCVAPLDYKAFSYKKVNQIDCPIYPLRISKPFIMLAKARGIDPHLFKFYNSISGCGGDFFEIKKTEDWAARNKYCHEQIVRMRESAIKSIETDGQWHLTPTIDELKLMIHLSSNLNKKEIADCVRNLMRNKSYLDLIKSVY